MLKKQHSSHGFAVLEILVIVIIVAAAGFAGYQVLMKNKDTKSAAASQSTVSKPAMAAKSSPSSSTITWGTDQAGNWTAYGGTPPTCPAQPMLKMPADTSKVTTVLYPGQTRGGNYKPHGGLRFDNITNNEVTVTAPIDGYIYRGARYLVSGETQYTFDVINSCGVMFRVGHLLNLTSKYQTLANNFPAATEGDSRTTRVDGHVSVTAGEQIATKVGTSVGGANTFFDFGVYDLRNKNAASTDATWAANSAHDPELAQHAVCWLKDWLPLADETRLNSLPAGDPTSGKNSDYCK